MGSWLPNAVRALYREHTDHMLAIVMTEGARNQAFFFANPEALPCKSKRRGGQYRYRYRHQHPGPSVRLTQKVFTRLWLAKLASEVLSPPRPLSAKPLLHFTLTPGADPPEIPPLLVGMLSSILKPKLWLP